jgi:hypothetical protein
MGELIYNSRIHNLIIGFRGEWVSCSGWVILAKIRPINNCIWGHISLRSDPSLWMRQTLLPTRTKDNIATLSAISLLLRWLFNWLVTVFVSYEIETISWWIPASVWNVFPLNGELRRTEDTQYELLVTEKWYDWLPRSTKQEFLPSDPLRMYSNHEKCMNSRIIHQGFSRAEELDIVTHLFKRLQTSPSILWYNIFSQFLRKIWQKAITACSVWCNLEVAVNLQMHVKLAVV